MDALNSINLPVTVAPGQTIDLSIDLIAPSTPGTYKGIWSFEDNTGQQFGLGASASGQVWVQVEVVLMPTNTPLSLPESTPTSEVTIEPTMVIPNNAFPSESLAFDFVSEICSAQWLNDNVQQACPGTSGETQSTISLVMLPTLEDGSTLINPAIMLSPGVTKNESIQGVYPEYLVQPGDHFRAIAGCEVDSISCSALLRVSYQDGSNTISNLWAVGEFYDQKYTQIDIDMSALAGQKVKIILDVTLLNTDLANHVFWASPGIYHRPLPTATHTIVPTPTATIPPVPTATLLPSPTPTPILKTEPQSLLKQIQDFMSDVLKNIFGR